MNTLHKTIDNVMMTQHLQDIMAPPAIIKQCIKQLKKGKGDGKVGFTSDHLINGNHRMHVFTWI